MKLFCALQSGILLEYPGGVSWYSDESFLSCGSLSECWSEKSWICGNWSIGLLSSFWWNRRGVQRRFMNNWWLFTPIIPQNTALLRSGQLCLKGDEIQLKTTLALGGRLMSHRTKIAKQWKGMCTLCAHLTPLTCYYVHTILCAHHSMCTPHHIVCAHHSMCTPYYVHTKYAVLWRLIWNRRRLLRNIFY